MDLGNKFCRNFRVIPVESIRLVIVGDGEFLRVATQLAGCLILFRSQRGRIDPYVETVAAGISGVQSDTQIILFGLLIHFQIVADPTIKFGLTIRLILVGTCRGVHLVQIVRTFFVLLLVVEGIQQISVERAIAFLLLGCDDLVLVSLGIHFGEIPIHGVGGLVQRIIRLKLHIGRITLDVSEFERQILAVGGIIGPNQILFEVLQPLGRAYFLAIHLGREDLGHGVR